MMKHGLSWKKLPLRYTDECCHICTQGLKMLINQNCIWPKVHFEWKIAINFSINKSFSRKKRSGNIGDGALALFPDISGWKKKKKKAKIYCNGFILHKRQNFIHHESWVGLTNVSLPTAEIYSKNKKSTCNLFLLHQLKYSSWGGMLVVC